MAVPDVTEALLRRWIRGQLSRAEGIAVARFVVRCRDPRLPALLDGMVQELREDRADAQLRARGPIWSGLVGAWHHLLDDAAAAWLPASGGLALAGSSPLGAREIRFSCDPDLVVDVSPPDEPDRLAVVSTDDRGHAELLHGPGGPCPAIMAPAPLPPRWTVWAVWGPPASWDLVDEHVDDPAVLVSVCMRSEQMTVRAARPYDDD